MNNLLPDVTDLVPDPLIRQVVLLDGRQLELVTGEICLVKTVEGDNAKLDLRWVNPSTVLGRSFFAVFTGLISTHSLAYCRTICRAFGTWLHELRMSNAESLVLSNLENLILQRLDIPKSYVDFIIPTLRHWKNQKLPGLSEDLISWLDDGYKLEESGTGAYFALITNDPERGALTIQELLNLHGALNRAYSNNLLGQTDFTLCWLFIGTGVRPIQVARMTKGDVRIDKESPEGNEVTLMVPLAKGEGVADQGKWARRAPSVLAECLVNYLALPEMQIRSGDDRLFDGSPQEIGTRLSRIFDKLDTWSDRLEGPIPINPYRFRYTLATRAIAQGASDYEVARLLTHRKTTCIRFYRASMPMLQRPLRENLGRELEFFAKAFQGRLIEDLAHATRANDEDALIMDFLMLSGKTLGACGTKAECFQHAPRACLPCDHFEPFYSAPWEDLLSKILEDTAIETEIRIKELNLNAISALHEIIRRRDDYLGIIQRRDLE